VRKIILASTVAALLTVKGHAATPPENVNDGEQSAHGSSVPQTHASPEALETVRGSFNELNHGSQIVKDTIYVMQTSKLLSPFPCFLILEVGHTFEVYDIDAIPEDGVILVAANLIGGESGDTLKLMRRDGWIKTREAGEDVGRQYAIFDLEDD